MKRQLFTLAEIGLPIDFDRMTLFPQEATDAITADAIGYPAHWANFTIAIRSAQEVRVSAGRYYAGGVVYASDMPTDINLQPHLPLVASDERWIAIVLRGSIVTVNEDRFVETSQDAETSEPVLRSLPKVEARQVTFAIQQGPLSPAPAIRPVVSETDACIAFVRITSAGVATIEPGELWRVKSLFEIDARTIALEGSLASLARRTTTIETDVANINARLGDIPRPEIVRQMRRDIAALRHEGSVPAGARSDWYDPGLIRPGTPGSQWDAGNTFWNARIDEGVRFPFANQAQARLELVNEDDQRVRFSGRRMMPRWTEVQRIVNGPPADGSRNISQLTHSNIVARRRDISRTAINFGPTITICTNAAEWANYRADIFAGGTFTRNGETFIVGDTLLDRDLHPHGERIVEVRSVRIDTWNEPVWDMVTEEIGVNGSIYGQTFLVPQAMIITSIAVNFTRVGSDGEVHLFLCETGPEGAPRIDRVLANVTLPRSQLALGWITFPFDPVLVEGGKRYAWFTVTTGNHALATTTGNKFTGGSLFLVSDGVWAQGDSTDDFLFVVHAARFSDVRTVVDFRNVTLENGMTEIRLLYPGWAPGGTALQWAVRAEGTSNWLPISAETAGLLAGLPSTVQLRATILNTPDLAPMIELNQNAVSRAARVGPEMRAASELIDFGLTTTTVQTETVLDEFDPAIHTFTPRIARDAAPTVLIAPDVSSIKIDPNNPKRRTVLSTYTVPPGTQRVRTIPAASTSVVTDVPFVQNTATYAL